MGVYGAEQGVGVWQVGSRHYIRIIDSTQLSSPRWARAD